MSLVVQMKKWRLGKVKYCAKCQLIHKVAEPRFGSGPDFTA